MEDRSGALLRLLNRPDRRPREPRRGIARVVAALLVVGSVASEVLLRLAPGSLAPQHQIELQQQQSRLPSAPDPQLGARSAPNLHQRVYTRDFEYLLETDAEGFPNRERPARVDVVLLGSASAIGPGVDRELQFAAQLAREFPGAGFLNLALPAAGPEQQYRVWHEHAAPLAPRLVISVLWVAGDVDDAVRFEQWLAAGGTADFDASSDARDARARGSGVLAWLREALTESYLARALVHAFRSFAGSRSFAEEVEDRQGHVLLLSVERQRALAQGLEHPGSAQLATAFLVPLERLAAEVRAVGGVFVLVLLPSKEELYGAPRAPAVLRRIDAVRALAAGRSGGALPVVDLYPVLGAATGGAVFFEADDHLTAVGHALVAEELARWLRESAVLGAAGAPTS